MKNEFRVMGETTVIIANGKGESYAVLIDTKDLDLVNTVEGTWCIAHEKNGKVGRVMCAGKKTKETKEKDIFLHKLILDYEGSLPIDHIDRDPLNNKRDNLRVSTTAKNGQNRAVGSNSSTGVRGLTWDKTANKYRGRVQVNGKRITIGHYETIEEGEQALKEYRTKNTTSID